MNRITMMALLPLLSAAALSACSDNPKPEIVYVSPPAIPAAQFECAAWPKPPKEALTSQKQVAAWVEGRVKPAFDDCKGKLSTAKTLTK